MDAQRHARASRLLNEALERRPGEREGFLRESCAGDAELERAVRALLDAHEATRGFDAAGSPGSAVRAAWEGRYSGAEEGERLGPYRLEEEIGRGGMGVVWRALDERLGRPVAVKTLRGALRSGAARDERLLREARLAARLSHPHVATVHDLPEHEGRLAIVMELLEGESLALRLRRGALPLGSALRLAAQVASALEAAHERGVVHRDLKPGNVHVLPSGDAKVLDFGIAGLAVAAEEEVEEPGEEGLTAVAGTPGYMSPEQVRGLELDGRSDLFSLGALLYECLAATPAFPGERPAERNRRILDARPDWDRLPAGAPSALVELLHRLLAVEPDDRPRSAAEPRRLLEALASELDAGSAAPIEADDFVGRGAELEALDALLAGGDRFVVIAGEAGVGKSRLVERALGDAAFPVLRCELGDAGGADEALSLLAAACGLRELGEQPHHAIADALAARGPLLLLLDDWHEDLPWLADLAGTLLARASELRLLATARAAPPGAAVLELGPLPVTEAAALVAARARQHDPSLELAAAADALAARLGGRPLALELAAARLRGLSAERLVASLDSAGPAGPLPLSDALDWAWQQLDPWERSALAQSSVFRGGFTPDAAEEVLDLSAHPDAPWGPEAMEILAAKDRLREGPEPGRLHLDRSVREHAAAQGSTDEARCRHARHFADLGSEGELRSRDGERGRERRALYRAESQNLRAALRWSLDAEEPALASRLLRAADAAAPGGSTELPEAARRLGASFDRPETLLAAGLVLARRGGPDEALALLERARAAFESAGDRRGLLNALSALSLLELAGDESARGSADEALALATELGADRVRGRVLVRLATLAARAGDGPRSEELAREAASELREAGDLEGLARALERLGACLGEAGRDDEAAAPLAEAEALRLRLGPG